MQVCGFGRIAAVPVRGTGPCSLGTILGDINCAAAFGFLLDRRYYDADRIAAATRPLALQQDIKHRTRPQLREQQLEPHGASQQHGMYIVTHLYHHSSAITRCLPCECAGGIESFHAHNAKAPESKAMER